MKFKTGDFTYQEIKKSQFTGDWPFISDSCMIGADSKKRYVVYLNNKCFALNGTAAKGFKLKTPHEGKRAVMGKSVQPFIEMAKGLK